jgi:hypothetical protein
MNELRFGLKVKKDGPFIKTVVDDGITRVIPKVFA